MEDVGYETSAYQTTPEPFCLCCERATKAGFDLVIAAGGRYDEVVNGVAGLMCALLAFIPTGTTNDYARAPMGESGVACNIEKTRTIQMDIGRASIRQILINIAAAGTLTELH